jgi:hypothetical protein
VLHFLIIGMGGLLLVVLFLVSAIVAVQARQRGYRFVIWVVTGMLGNPIFFLVLLAIMPDFARKALRGQILADLEAKLAGRPKVLPAAPAPAPTSPLPRPTAQPSTMPSDRSLGDQPTILPERSLGDQATLLPPERSLGDEDTRG